MAKLVLKQLSCHSFN